MFFLKRKKPEDYKRVSPTIATQEKRMERLEIALNALEIHPNVK
jgi:hypothetical protein